MRSCFRVLHLFPLCLFSLLFSSSVRGANPADPSSGLPAVPVVAESIVVTASAAIDTLDRTPASITVITRDDLEQMAARDVVDALRLVPGLQISRTGSAGKATSLFTRGSNSTHTLVLWNGVEINNPYFSGYDWGRFSTQGVEKIEVVRGPFSALYGSDAVGGVVNVLTSPLASSLEAVVEAGGDGLLNVSARGSQVGDSWSLFGAVESRSDDGFEANDDFSQESALGGIGWSDDSRFSIRADARWSRYDTGVPRSPAVDGSGYVPSPERRLEGGELQINLPVRGRAGNLDWAVELSESRRNDQFSDPDDPYFLTASETDSVTRRGRATLQIPSGIGTATIGGEWEQATVDDDSSYGVNLDGAERTSRSLFAEDRVSVSVGHDSFLEVVAGVRFDDYETFGSELSPRLSVAWLRGANKFRAGYGEAFRAPAVGELYFPFFGNPELEPEESRSAEIGLERAFAGDQRVSATVFWNDFDQLIVYDNVASRFTNVGAAETRGIEFGATTSPGGRFIASAAYTLLHTEQKDTGDPLLRRPRHSGSLMVGYRAAPWSAELITMYNGARSDVAEILPYGRVEVDPYTVTDFVLSRALGSVHPFVRVENVADQEFEEVFGYPSPGRRFVAGFRYRAK